MKKNNFLKRLNIGKTFVIAEAGVNHNGSVELAEKLIVEAKKSGADAVKFQTFKAEKVVVKGTSKALYQKKVTNPDETQLDMLKKLELKKEDFKHLKSVCSKHKIMFLSTPYNYEDVELLCELEVEAIKLASMHLVELPFLKYVAQKDLPIILSTGMATIGEIDDAINTITDAGNTNIVLLQCTTDYPTKPDEANLSVIHTFESIYPFPIGYSDHTEGYLASCLAVGYGAKLLEKHFTLNRNMKGPDHLSSLDPKQFSEFVKQVRLIEKLIGNKIKKPTKSELLNKVSMRRSLVLLKDKNKGETIEEKDLDFSRPGTGIPVNELPNIVGRKLNKTLKKGTVLRYDDI